MENIIFDLGGVILDVDFSATEQAFEDLGIENFSQYFTPLKQQALFEHLELGIVELDNFYQAFRELTHSQLTNQQIEEAWNQMITHFDSKRMALLEALAERYNIYLFSNTNAIHVKCFEARCQLEMGQPLSHYFREIYYSNKLYLRKPSVESFRKVLNLSGLKASDTLFIDDNIDNINGAQAAGLQTLHLQFPQTILDLEF